VVLESLGSVASTVTLETLKTQLESCKLHKSGAHISEALTSNCKGDGITHKYINSLLWLENLGH